MLYPPRLPEREWLAHWADVVTRWLADDRETWIFFNNDAEGHAVRDAARLRAAVERRRAASRTR